jgi:hypothetical protein
MTEDDSHGHYRRSVAVFIAVVADGSSIIIDVAMMVVIDATSAQISTCPT